MAEPLPEGYQDALRQCTGLAANLLRMATEEPKEIACQNSKDKADFEPKIFTTQPKNGKRRKNKRTIIEEGTAKSRLSSIERELGLSGLFEGEVYHLSFDCPKPLAKAFKEATKANGTSICKELQKYALSYVVEHHIEKSAFGSTISKILKPKLTIENLNFEQYVQNRPRRLLRGVEVRGARDVSGVSGESLTCMIGVCDKPAVEVMVYQPKGKESKDYRVCAFHASAYAGVNSWRFKK